MRKFLLSVAAAAMMLAGCDDGQEVVAEPEVVRPARVVTVEGPTAVETRRFVGRVDAVQTVNLSFQVGGRLVELPVREGEIVPKGGLIAAIDATDYELALREAEVRMELARQEWERQRTLSERGVASSATLDEAKANYDLAVVALDTARQNLAYTRIHAPFDALVSRRLVDNFTNIQPGQEVVRVQDMTELRINVNVPEALLATVQERDVVSVDAVFPFLPDQRFPLTYREHASEPDPATQTYRVSLGMPRPEEPAILPGMTASVLVSLDRPNGTPSYMVPAAAVATNNDGSFFVWVVDPESAAVAKRPVEVGALGNARIPVLEGLREGEVVVAAGVHHLREGMRVRPLEGL